LLALSEECVMDAKEFLNAYLGDLLYHAEYDGIGSVNHVSCSTPYFETEHQLWGYIEDLKSVIDQLEEPQA
jgi:hypothetical protein